MEFSVITQSMDVPHFLESMQRWWFYICVSGMEFVVFPHFFSLSSFYSFSNDHKKLMLILWIRHISILINVLGMPSNTRNKVNKHRSGFSFSFSLSKSFILIIHIKLLPKIKRRNNSILSIWMPWSLQFCVDSFVSTTRFQIVYGNLACRLNLWRCCAFAVDIILNRNTTSKTSLFKRIKSLLYFKWVENVKWTNSMDGQKSPFFVCVLFVWKFHEFRWFSLFAHWFSYNFTTKKQKPTLREVFAC